MDPLRAKKNCEPNRIEEGLGCQCWRVFTNIGTLCGLTGTSVCPELPTDVFPMVAFFPPTLTPSGREAAAIWGQEQVDRPVPQARGTGKHELEARGVQSRQLRHKEMTLDPSSWA